MEKERVDQIFYSAINNLIKVKLLSSYNASIYKDFPQNIPEAVKAELDEKAKLASAGAIKKAQDRHFQVADIGAIGYAHANWNYILYGDDTHGEDFLQIIMQQEWITYFAYVEAFFQDICRFIYSHDTSLLTSYTQKQMMWRDIVLSGSYQTLLDKMIDETIEKSGYKNLADQIEKWNREPYLLRISVDKDELLLLRWSISTRNIIIHNNAKINKDHYILTEKVAALKNTESELDPVGSKLILESVSLSGVYMLLYNIVEQVYSAVVGKYFRNTWTDGQDIKPIL